MFVLAKVVGVVVAAAAFQQQEYCSSSSSSSSVVVVVGVCDSRGSGTVAVTAADVM